MVNATPLRAPAALAVPMLKYLKTRTESQLMISPPNCSAEPERKFTLPGPRRSSHGNQRRIWLFDVILTTMFLGQFHLRRYTMMTTSPVRGGRLRKRLRIMPGEEGDISI